MKKILSIWRNFNFYSFAVLYILAVFALLFFPGFTFTYFIIWTLAAYVINALVNIFILKREPNEKREPHKNPVFRLIFDMKPFRAWLALMVSCVILIVISFLVMFNSVLAILTT